MNPDNNYGFSVHALLNNLLASTNRRRKKFRALTHLPKTF